MKSDPKYPEPTLTADIVKQSRISKLRDKRNQLSDDQWENVLHSTLLQRRTHGPAANTLENVEVLASIAGDQLSIIFRNNISGITQKLGELIFKKDESQELDITRWAGAAAKRSNRLDREVQDLTAMNEEQSKRMEKLSLQLEDLIKAKLQHESSLLQKFAELLNTKKLKIRDQQRLLASAKLDPSQAAKLQNARSISKPRASTISRPGKRKATSSRRASDSSEGSGFEEKAPKQKPWSDLSEQMNTPEHSDQGITEDESSGDPNSSSHIAELPDRISKSVDGAKGAKGEEMQLDALPPTRDLPFGEGGGREQTKRPVTGDMSTLDQEAGNEDDETDDDEL